MRRTIIESPYAATHTTTVDDHTRYARRALAHSLALGEAPIASHLLYTQVLDDQHPILRHQGITAGHAWISAADVLAVYTDYGVSKGMEQALAAAAGHLDIVTRTIGRNDTTTAPMPARTPFHQALATFTLHGAPASGIRIENTDYDANGARIARQPRPWAVSRPGHHPTLFRTWAAATAYATALR